MDLLLQSLILSASLGALIGLIRQWGDQQDENKHGSSFAGLRTFVLWALIGYTSAFLSDSYAPYCFVVALVMVALPATAYAQDIDDLDADERAKVKKSKSKSKSKKESKQAAAEVVREIDRGFFLKAGAGMGGFLLTYGPISNGFAVLNAGTTVSLSVGNDAYDTETTSMAWEVQFTGGVYNGMTADDQVYYGAKNYIQGDTQIAGRHAVGAQAVEVRQNSDFRVGQFDRRDRAHLSTWQLVADHGE